MPKDTPEFHVAPDAAQQARIVLLTTALQQAMEFAERVSDCRITYADVDDIMDHQAALDHAIRMHGVPTFQRGRLEDAARLSALP
jgi:DICT domain-containing protein